MSSAGAPPKSLIARALLYVALAGLAVHILHQSFGLGGSGLDWLLGRSLYYGLVACAAGACALMFGENRTLLSASRAEARTDPLTGLGNRRRLIEDLTRLIDRGNEQSLFALFDLDGFKAYNDSFGHPAGDALLEKMAQNLEGAFSSDGAAYRTAETSSASSSPWKRPAASRSRLPRPRSRSRAAASRSAARGVPCSSPRKPTTPLRRSAWRTGGCTSRRAAGRARPSARPATCSCAPCTSARPRSATTCRGSRRLRLRSARPWSSTTSSSTRSRGRRSCTTSARSACLTGSCASAARSTRRSGA